MKYRKKPVVIDAIQLTPQTIQQVREFITTEFTEAFTLDDFGKTVPIINIRTLEGWIQASNGDYIIKGVAGEFYPCKPAIFDATYELVETVDNKTKLDPACSPVEGL
jgi:hypothetical protein